MVVEYSQAFSVLAGRKNSISCNSIRGVVVFYDVSAVVADNKGQRSSCGCNCFITNRFHAEASLNLCVLC